MAAVPTTVAPGMAEARSPVMTPDFRTFATAASMQAAASDSPREWRSIMAAERIWAIGLAMPLPAMSGAEPPAGS